MANGISLHIGLNSVNPNIYGTSGTLRACENDANSMASIARQLKYGNVNLLLTRSATRRAVINAIKNAAQTLNAGDIFFLTYSGHGGNLPDNNGDEDDNTDETWCLYDGQLLDDELYSLWSSFKPNVRIIVLSDSCHSGTVTKAQFYNLPQDENSLDETSYKFLPRKFTQNEYEANREVYSSMTKSPKKELSCTVKLISGCQDNQLSSDGRVNGLFTEKLLKVWNKGAFTKDYQAFHNEIVKLLPSDQTPNYFTIGATNAAFDKQKPFTV